MPKTQNQKDAEGFLGRLTGKGGSGGQTEKAVVRKTAKTPVNAKDRSERSVVTEAGLGKGPQPGKGPKKSAA